MNAALWKREGESTRRQSRLVYWATVDLTKTAVGACRGPLIVPQGCAVKRVVNMGPKWQRGDVPGRRGRPKTRGETCRKRQQPRRCPRLVGCRIESLVEMGKTSGRRFVCRRRAWTGETGSRGRQLDSGHGHGWGVGDGQRGARKENNARSDSRGAMCAIRDPTIVEVAREMGFGASGPAECCRAGKRRGLDRKSDDNPVAKPILFSVPLSAWQAGLGAGRANLQGRGGFETRPHAGVGLTVAVDAALLSVGLAGTGPNGKRAHGMWEAKSTYIGIPGRPIFKWPWPGPAYGNGQWQWQWQTSRGGGTGNGLGRHLQRAGPDDPSGPRWPTAIYTAAYSLLPMYGER